MLLETLQLEVMHTITSPGIHENLHLLWAKFWIFWKLFLKLRLGLKANINHLANSVMQSGVACSWGHRYLTPPGRCSAEETGAEKDPHLNVSAAQRTSVGCSPSAPRALVGFHLRRSVRSSVKTDLSTKYTVSELSEFFLRNCSLNWKYLHLTCS